MIRMYNMRMLRHCSSSPHRRRWRFMAKNSINYFTPFQQYLTSILYTKTIDFFSSTNLYPCFFVCFAGLERPKSNPFSDFIFRWAHTHPCGAETQQMNGGQGRPKSGLRFDTNRRGGGSRRGRTERGDRYGDFDGERRPELLWKNDVTWRHYASWKCVTWDTHVRNAHPWPCVARMRTPRVKKASVTAKRHFGQLDYKSSVVWAISQFNVNNRLSLLNIKY